MRTEPKLRSSGIFYGVIFLVGALMNIVTSLIAGETILSLLADFTWIGSLILISAVMFLSGYVAKLAWIQPALFLLITPFNMMTSRDSFYGLAFYAVAILLLLKLEFFNKHRALKSICCLAYLFAIEIVSVLHNKEPLEVSIQPVFFIVAFIAFILLTFREKIFVYLKEPKPKLSLEAKGLSEAEQVYVRVILAGRGVKDASFESGVSESTVRNTLSRAYKKLGVVNRAGLVALAEKYEVV
jgi:DNA-binding CsgD family transcriptional regulator